MEIQIEVLYYFIGVVFIILPIIVLLFYYLYHRNIYNKNKSQNYFNLNYQCEIDFKSKYTNLENEHNLHCRIYKFLPVEIIVILGICALFFINIKYGVILLISVILFVIITNEVLNMNKKKTELSARKRKNSPEEQKAKLKEEYYNIILKDIILDIFKATQEKLLNYSILNEDMSEEEFEYKYNIIENEEKKRDVFLSKIFKETNKKIFPIYNMEFCIDFEINKQKIKLSRVTNYKITNSGTNQYMYSFVGYLIQINNFFNIERLNELNKNDYFYDKNNNILYILISDQIKSNCFLSQNINRFVPKLYLKFEEEKFLSKNYIFFNQLYNFIINFLLY